MVGPGRLFSLFLYLVYSEAPQLFALLKEMKEGLDSIRSKIQSLTVQVWYHIICIKERSLLFFSFFSPLSQIALSF